MKVNSTYYGRPYKTYQQHPELCMYVYMEQYCLGRVGSGVDQAITNALGLMNTHYWLHECRSELEL